MFYRWSRERLNKTSESCSISSGGLDLATVIHKIFIVYTIYIYSHISTTVYSYSQPGNRDIFRRRSFLIENSYDCHRSFSQRTPALNVFRCDFQIISIKPKKFYRFPRVRKLESNCTFSSGYHIILSISPYTLLA